MTPEQRCCFDNVFLFADDFHSNKKRLYDHYGGFVPSFKKFEEILQESTHNHEMLMIDNTGTKINYSYKLTKLTAKCP